MADFKTHLMGAAVVSGLAATTLVMTGQFPHQAVIGYFILGVIGGLLPDIDSPHSIPVRIAFMGLAVIAGFLVVFTFGRRYSLVELILLWIGCFALIRYGVFELLDRYTVHRGLIHSIPMGVSLRFSHDRPCLSSLQCLSDPCLDVRDFCDLGLSRPFIAGRVLQRQSVRQKVAEKILWYRFQSGQSEATHRHDWRFIWR